MANLTKKSIPKLVEWVKPARLATNQDKSQPKVPLLMEKFCQKNNLLSYPTRSPNNVGSVGGNRSYMMLGSLAKLEHALMRWTMNELLSKHNFEPVTVPNIVYDSIIEKCGFPTDSERSQVYKVSGNNQNSIWDENLSVGMHKKHRYDPNMPKPCISGTSEFSLAAMHLNESIPYKDLPKRYCALSCCYRAETSDLASEWGLYRVRYFNKVEMFAFVANDKSEETHNEFLRIQRNIFEQLDLEFKILDMPEDDLGLSATKKYDIEAWMPGRQRFGEISSTSNCRDYQSSRLNVRFNKMIESNEQLQVKEDFVHTVNGTACSSIRTIIAILEQHQSEDGESVTIPKPLVPYMNGVTSIPSERDKNLLSKLQLYSESDQNNS